MQIAIAENSRVVLDQDEYEKHYAELTARYEKAKAKYDDIAEQIERRQSKNCSKGSFELWRSRTA